MNRFRENLQLLKEEGNSSRGADETGKNTDK